MTQEAEIKTSRNISTNLDPDGAHTLAGTNLVLGGGAEKDKENATI